MRYRDCARTISLKITKGVSAQFETYIKTYDYKIESGGILVGILESVHNTFEITDITEPFGKDERTKYRFQRSEYGHQEAMNRLWEQSGYKKTYLGEWHTHDEEIPTPSVIDLKNWIRISSRKTNNSNKLFFIIIGTKKVGVWMVANKKIEKLECVE